MIEVPGQLKPLICGFELGDLYDGPRATGITLLQRIYGGPQRWSQVYQATIDAWNQPVSERQLPEHFVLKIYVEDWDPYGLDHHDPQAEEEQRTMLELETRAYRRLVGCPVTPRWYGTYQVSIRP